MKRDRAARIDPASARADLRGASAGVDAPETEQRLKDLRQRPLLTATEAAELLEMSLPALYAYTRRHRIPNAIKGRALRFRPEDLFARRTSPATDTLTDFAELGRQHARGRV